MMMMMMMMTKIVLENVRSHVTEDCHALWVLYRAATRSNTLCLIANRHLCTIDQELTDVAT